ncbi:hypothetical protein BH10ACI1_BH10ACI1_13180 [soil metagenome]
MVGTGFDNVTPVDLVLLPDTSMIVGGGFSSYQGSVRSGLVRILRTGAIDLSFDPQQGTRGATNKVALQSNGKVIVGGGFSQYRSEIRFGIARIASGLPNAIWGEGSKATATFALDGTFFGKSVAIDGDTAVVAAKKSHDGAANGAAYVYVRNGTNWTLQQELIPSDSAEDDQFGNSVAISGNTIVVGSPYDDIGSNENQGSAYIFVRNGTTWTEHQKLSAINGAEADSFGYSVAIDNDIIVIGVPYKDIGGNASQGSASVYTPIGANWFFTAELTALDGTEGDSFGRSVAIDGGTVVIGAPNDFGMGISGSAYIFTGNLLGWLQANKGDYLLDTR